MGKQDYPRLDIVEFGKHLLDSGDLDPVYIALHKAGWSEEYLYRWLIAYWCFYSAGAACYIAEAEGREFWLRMMVAAKNEEPTPFGGRWPRGHERRHFRGDAAVQATKKLMGRYLNAPEDMVRYIADSAHAHETVPFAEVANRVKEHPLFGPWIAFKVADMLDRLEIQRVDFDEAAVFMFKDPTEAALMLWRQTQGLPETARPKDQKAVIHAVVAHLKETFKDYTAPPLHERPVDLQEVETILCCWKSHTRGHYPKFNDTHEINDGLADWLAHSNPARDFAYAMPNGE